MVDVVEVLGHILLVLFKCNRVTNQALLGFAGLLAVGQFTITHNLPFGAIANDIISAPQYLGLRPAMALGSSLGSSWTVQTLVQLHSPSSSASVSPTTSHQIHQAFLGLGIDDMFALVTTCQNLTELETQLPREEKLGLVGDHHHFNLLTRLSGDEARWCRDHHHHLHRPGCLRHWLLFQSLFCQVSELGLCSLLNQLVLQQLLVFNFEPTCIAETFASLPSSA